MRTVWKYTWPGPGAAATLKMPDGAQIIHVARQHGHTTLWAIVDPGAEKVERGFVIVGTGHTMPVSLGDLAHVGSVLTEGGTFVFHVFEVLA